MIYEPEKDTIKLAQKLRQGDYKKIVLVSWHGAGDQTMFLAPLHALRSMFPNIQIDVAVCKGIGQTSIIAGAIEVDGDWRETLPPLYDLVVQINFPLEDISRPNITKSEVCCMQELGINPISGYFRIPTKPICGVCFNITSLPQMCNPDEETAKKIWQDIIDSGYIPVEIMMEHPFHNPVNARFPFVDNSLRNWKADLDTLMAMISKCDRLCSVVTGVFHLGMSILGKDKVMLLEKDIPLGCFTKDKIATANLKNYQGEVKTWFQNTYTL